VSLTRSQMDAELRKLYDQIPAIPDCDGRCWTSCGPIDMSDRERQRIRQAGYRITPWQDARAWKETYYCEALTGDKRCAVYEMRPLVCRLWGAVEGMPCVYGCIPEGGRWMSDEDAFRLIAASQRIGGHANALSSRDLEEALTVDWLRGEIERIRQRGQAGDRLRMDEQIPAAFRRRGQ
jgi:Fe-S-cluster containining protein